MPVDDVTLQRRTSAAGWVILSVVVTIIAVALLWHALDASGPACESWYDSQTRTAMVTCNGESWAVH